MSLPSQDDIRDYLSRRYQPRAILLYGSRLRGDGAALSDYDIVIVKDDPADVFPHKYKGVSLDLSGAKPDYDCLLGTGGVPQWPVEAILDDASGTGAAICARTKAVFDKGPVLLSAQEWENRKNMTERLIEKIAARGGDVMLRRYYLGNFYARVIRYWFEKRNRWMMSPHRALPIIAAEEAVFHAALVRLWGDDAVTPARELQIFLFGE